MEPLQAGCRVLEVADEVQGVNLLLRVFYPAHGVETTERIGPYELTAVFDAPLEGTDLPLVLISHGGKSTGLTHRGMATHLARAGYVVAVPEHRGDSRGDTSLSGKAENLANRPRHLTLSIDAVLGHPLFSTHLDAQKIAVIGHSLGGYTALAVAGGRPTAGPRQTPDGQMRRVPVVPDPRVKALVVLAPACAWYAEPGSLRAINVPMLLLIAERDEIAEKLRIEFIERDCDPKLLQREVIPNAGHFAFQSPFPKEMNRTDFPPARDPEGFDRAAFQPELYARILTFLRNQP